MRVYLHSAILAIVLCSVHGQYNMIESDGCSYEVSEEVDKIVNQCVREVMAATMLGMEKTMPHGIVAKDLFRNLRRKRETSANELEQKTLGCVLQCVLNKYNLLGEDDLPTRHGLLTLVTNNTTDKAYFMAATKIIDRCYYIIRDYSYQGKQQVTQDVFKGHCGVVYEAFDCIENGFDEYCGDKK